MKDYGVLLSGRHDREILALHTKYQSSFSSLTYFHDISRMTLRPGSKHSIVLLIQSLNIART